MKKTSMLLRALFSALAAKSAHAGTYDWTIRGTLTLPTNAQISYTGARTDGHADERYIYEPSSLGRKGSITYKWKWVPNGTVAQDPPPSMQATDHYEILGGPLAATGAGQSSAAISATLYVVGGYSHSLYKHSQGLATQIPQGEQTVTGRKDPDPPDENNENGDRYMTITVDSLALSRAEGSAYQGDAVSAAANNIAIKTLSVTLAPLRVGP